jgi:hypothetical protein
VLILILNSIAVVALKRGVSTQHVG